MGHPVHIYLDWLIGFWSLCVKPAPKQSLISALLYHHVTMKFICIRQSRAILLGNVFTYCSSIPATEHSTNIYSFLFLLVNESVWQTATVRYIGILCALLCCSSSSLMFLPVMQHTGIRRHWLIACIGFAMFQFLTKTDLSRWQTQWMNLPSPEFQAHLRKLSTTLSLQLRGRNRRIWNNETHLPWNKHKPGSLMFHTLVYNTYISVELYDTDYWVGRGTEGEPIHPT